MAASAGRWWARVRMGAVWAVGAPVLALLAACAARPPTQAAAPASLPFTALAQAAIVGGDAPDRPLTPLLTPRVRLLTWNAVKPGMTPGASYTFPYPVWLTVDGEVRDFCRRWAAAHPGDGAALQARLEQLLGLRPGDGAGRSLITIEVDRERIFRPCPDPAVDTTACRATFDRAGLSAALDKDPAATRFLLEQMIFSYTSDGGYPFTRRGYTYDWSDEAAAQGHVGLSEYLTRANTTVTITQAPQDVVGYCAPGP